MVIILEGNGGLISSDKIIPKIAPDNMGEVLFTLGGADANENAVKMARMYTGRNKVFSFLMMC